MENKFICEFCGKKFSTKSNLTAHKSKAKYCISQRNDNTIPITNYPCKYCDKVYTSSHMLIAHEQKCNAKSIAEQELMYKTKLNDKEKENKLLRKEIKNLIKQIESLQDKLASIAIEGVTYRVQGIHPSSTGEKPKVVANMYHIKKSKN